MAGRQVAGEGIPASLAGMSKSQLYDIMSQMKTLIELNKQQARQILIQNPGLTKALFQAQIMLGMVQPPQAAPASVNPQQQTQIQQSNGQAAPSNSANVGLNQVRKSNVPVTPSQSAAPLSHPSQLQQAKGNLGGLSPAISLPQPPQAPIQLPQPPSLIQPPTQIPSQSQQSYLPQQSSLLTTLQPPARPPIQGFSHQPHAAQAAATLGVQHGGPQLHHSQHMIRPGAKPPSNLGPSFPLGQLPLPNQPQSAYQVGSSWPPGLHESQLPAPPPFGAQPGPSNQPPRAAALTPELEKALLQQVMSLTPDQINMLPLDQRNQVLQLQQVLRQ